MPRKKLTREQKNANFMWDYRANLGLPDVSYECRRVGELFSYLRLITKHQREEYLKERNILPNGGLSRFTREELLKIMEVLEEDVEKGLPF